MSVPRRAHWLLDASIDGQVYRWAVELVEVTDSDGSTRWYRPGLSDLALARGEIGVEIELVDRSVDWPTLAVELEGREVILRRWIEGTTLEEAEVYARGVAAGIAHGARYEPVSFVIADVSGAPSSLGVAVPDPLARVDETTWPITASTLGDEGATYPVIFGYPGYVGDSTPVCVVPVPMGQWNALDSTTYLVVSEDADAPISTVRIRNDSTDAEADETASIVQDNLGRSVVVVNFSSSSAPKPSDATEQRELFAGYDSAGGGGVARSAYDVIAYLLRRWGPDTADWVQLPQVEAMLSAFQVDSWIDAPVEDPWAWIEGVLLPDLPVEIRTSLRGRYLVERRYRPDGTRLVGSLEAGAGVERVGLRTRSEDGPYNEFTAFYRANTLGDWLARVVLTGEPSVGAAPGGVSAPDPSTSQLVSVQRSGLCTASYARYGLRQSEPIEVDWTWDTGTIAAVLTWRAERDASPAWLVSYDVRDGDQLQEGDEVSLTDAELGLSSVLAIVDAPPVVDRSRWASVTLRMEG